MVQTKSGEQNKNTNFITSEKFLATKAATKPIVSSNMARSVSGYRRGVLEEEILRGNFQDANNPIPKEILSSPAGYIVSSSKKISKTASAGDASGSGQVGGGYRGGGGTLRQSPNIYSPLWLNSNLNLPRDRATVNAWSRAFFALNGYVHNAIDLHSTYPISKLNIKCKSPAVEKFFQEMIEELNLIQICSQIAQEYWIIGEAFIYAELDEAARKWNRLIIQNPDYMVVQRSVVDDEPIISIRPDDNLKRICTSQKASDQIQRQKLDKSIIEHVRRGENIPLNNFYVHHIARKINSYDVRGTGLIVNSFKPLMLFDKLIECYDEETEILTQNGFKKFSEVIDFDALNNEKGVIHSAPKENVKIACFNSETNHMEYHTPSSSIVKNYEGEMYNFDSRNLNVCVTPEHDMWVEKINRLKGVKGFNPWHKLAAKDINPKTTYRCRSVVEWKGKDIEYVDVLNKKVPIEIYLKFLGYLISEGCLSKPLRSASISLTQSIKSDCIDDMKNSINDFAKVFDKHVGNYIRETKMTDMYKNKPNDRWCGTICSNDLYDYFKKEISVSEEFCTAEYKRIPRWILELNKKYLKIILDALLYGDGSTIKQKKSTANKYYTSSKQLADDVQEIALKCGYSSNITKRQRKHLPEYMVHFSTATDGDYPYLIPNNKRSKPIIYTSQYNGRVYCVNVPTGLLVVRRNNKISIQGNCKYAQADDMVNPVTLVKIGGDDYKPTPADLASWRDTFEEASNDLNFKIFTHDKVAVERVGANSAILDINPDLERIVKQVLTGLMVPSVLMDGGADTTYANGSVALDVLKSRYMAFRNKLTLWLRKKIFAPIAKMNDFYEKVDGKNVLIIPDIEWNHMSLFDMGDYTQILKELSSGETKIASKQTLFKSMGLAYEDENQKIRQESIDETIREKEKEALSQMSLSELRALGPNDQIKEVIQSPLPGEERSLPGQQDDGSSGGGLPGMEDLGGGMGSSSPPPPPPAPEPSSQGPSK